MATYLDPNTLPQPSPQTNNNNGYLDPATLPQPQNQTPAGTPTNPAASQPTTATTPILLDDNGNPISMNKVDPGTSVPIGTKTNPGETTLDNPVLRFESNLTNNPYQAASYLKTQLPKDNFDVDGNNNVIYSQDNGSTWNKLQTTFPNEFNWNNIISSLAQKEPNITEAMGAGTGATLGAAGGPFGSMAGAGAGGALATGFNQYLASKIGVAPTTLGAGTEQALIHGGLDAAGEGLGKYLLAPAVTALIKGNPVGSSISDAIAGRALSPTEQFGPLAGAITNKLLRAQGSLPDTAMRASNEGFTEDILNNLDKEIGTIPQTPGPSSTLGGNSPFSELPTNTAPTDLNPNLKAAIQADKANATNFFNDQYNILKQGGNSELNLEKMTLDPDRAMPSLLDQDTPGLNNLEVNKPAFIKSIMGLNLTTPEGNAAATSIMKNITDDDSDSLGDFFETKKSFNSDLSPISKVVPGALSINKDYSAIKGALDDEFQNQITNPDLADSFNKVQAINSDYQNTLNLISKSLSKGQDVNGLQTAQVMTRIKPLLENLQNSDNPDLLSNTLPVYKRYLAAQLKNQVMPPVPGNINWGALNQASTNLNGLNKMDFLQQLLPIGDETGTGQNVVDQIGKVRQIASNPTLFPSQLPTKPGMLDNLGDIGSLAKLLTGTLTAPVKAVKNLALQPLYNPGGALGRAVTIGSSNKQR